MPGGGILYQPGYVVESGPRLQPQPSPLPRAAPPEAERSVAPTLPTHVEEADYCLKCKREAAGARYRFCVAMRGQLRRIVYEEGTFICERCARARLRYAPLVVLIFWLPILALAMWITGLWVSLLLLFITVGLIRLVWKQLRAIRYRLYHSPPYSGSVARLAIHLRKREVLRSLHLSESQVSFLTEEDRDQPTGRFSAE